MFKPNSIQGLPEGKDEIRITNPIEGQEIQEAECYDPEIQDIVDLKCAIKDVDSTISNIREWRQQQNRNLQRNLKLNKEAFEVKQPNEGEKEVGAKQNEQLAKFKAKMNTQMKNIEQLLKEPELKQSDYLNQHQTLLISEMVADRVQQCQKRKNELSKNRDAKIDDSKEAFIESLQDMNEIFKHPTTNSSSAAPAEQKVPADKKKIKADLEEIDRELKQLQQLLQ